MLIYNYLKKDNIMIPPKEDNIKEDKYEGAYVKDPIQVCITGLFHLI